MSIILLRQILLLAACLHFSVAFTSHTSSLQAVGRYSFCLCLRHTSRGEANNAKADTLATQPSVPSRTVLYKDDCFGLITFIAGFGTQDVFFTVVFVGLSLLADLITRLGTIFPADGQDPSSRVHRVVPAMVALFTLVVTSDTLSPIVSLLLSMDGNAKQMLLDTAAPPSWARTMLLDTTTPPSWARILQVVLGAFSVGTGVFNIRWRDRFGKF